MPDQKKNATIRLRANRNGKGYVTSYTLCVGCAEARSCGFLDESGQPVPLEKVLDAAAGTLTVRAVPPDSSRPA